MKSKRSLLLICSLIALAVAVVVFGIVLLARQDYKSDIRIRIGKDGATQKTLEIEATGLYPGASQKYSLALVYEDTKNYHVTLAFKETGTGTLSEFVSVDFVTQTEKKTYTLAELLAGEIVEFIGNTPTIDIIYSIPQSVGNEAQGAVLYFNIELSALAEGK